MGHPIPGVLVCTVSFWLLALRHHRASDPNLNHPRHQQDRPLSNSLSSLLCMPAYLHFTREAPATIRPKSPCFHFQHCCVHLRFPKIECASHPSFLFLFKSYRTCSYSIAAAPLLVVAVAVAAVAVGGREERRAAAGLEALPRAGGNELPAVRAVVWRGVVWCGVSKRPADRGEWTKRMPYRP